MVTLPMFSVALDRTRSTPSMPNTASSTRRVMPSSTSVGVAPGYGTLTLTMPGSTVGNTCDVSCKPASRPPTSIKVISRFAATGLCAKYGTSPVPGTVGRGSWTPMLASAIVNRLGR